jgi:transposase InsO family protein
MVCNMSRKDNCWDNAAAEPTIGTIKREFADDLVFEDRHALRTALLTHIEASCHRLRIHSTVGYRTPRSLRATPCSAGVTRCATKLSRKSAQSHGR